MRKRGDLSPRLPGRVGHEKHEKRETQSSPPSLPQAIAKRRQENEGDRQDHHNDEKSLHAWAGLVVGACLQAIGTQLSENIIDQEFLRDLAGPPRVDLMAVLAP